MSNNKVKIYAIPKQTFRQKNPLNNTWKVKVKVQDQFGKEEEREWNVTNSYYNLANKWFFNLTGNETAKDKKYEKCICKVNIYDNQGEKLVTITQHMKKDSFFNRFHLNNAYDLGYDGGNFSNGVDFSMTFVSCRLNKSKIIVSQKKMLDDSKITDAVIKTKNQNFPCHKVILAAESDYFRAMFESDMLEKETNTVDWTELFDEPVVKDLLHFIYTGSKPPNIKENHFELMRAAHYCVLPELKVMCTKSLQDIINVDNAASILQMAEMYEAEELKLTVSKFVLANCPKVFATNGFQQIETKFKLRMLESAFLAINKLKPNIS